MSRLVIPTNSEAQNVVEGLYKDLERRIIASPPGLCPVDLTAAFLKMCHAQTCGKSAESTRAASIFKTSRTEKEP